MSLSKVMIHVGLHKTASTFLQRQVFPCFRQYVLLSKPYLGTNSAFNALIYGDDTIYRESLVRQEINAVVQHAESDGSTGLILSEEEFSGHPEYNFVNRGLVAHRLARIFPDAEILLVLRSQSDLICSLYNQFVKAGRFSADLDQSFLHRPGPGMTFHEWLNGEYSHVDVSKRWINSQALMIPDHFRYSEIHSLYARLFRRVHILLFEELHDNPPSFLAKLASILSVGLPDALKGPDPVRRRYNEGLSPRRLIAQRWRLRLTGLGLPRRGTAVDVLSKGLALLSPDHSSKYREHVMHLLRERQIFSDNERINWFLGLGMERFPELYFDQ